MADNNLKISRLRPLFVLKILYDKTDETHTITISQILQELYEKYGITSYRKTIKEDIDLLISADYDIAFIKSSQNQYQIKNRDFDIAELKILMDAVASSKFISRAKSQELSDKLSRLGGPFFGESLPRNIDVERRVKSENKQLFLIVDTLNTAINKKKKVAFKYYSYNAQKEKREKHRGFVYKFSPYRLVWNGDFYYVVGYSDSYERISSFRVDRISEISNVLEENAVLTPKDFDINDYLDSMFKIYNEVQKEVELVCDNSVMDSILDRFGEDVSVFAHDMKSFRVIVKTPINHIFYGWVFGFGGKIKIRSPIDVKNDYYKMLKESECEL